MPRQGCTESPVGMAWPATDIAPVTRIGKHKPQGTPQNAGLPKSRTLPLKKAGWRLLARRLPLAPALVIRYGFVFLRIPHLKNPSTFNEKILIRMIRDRDPKLSLYHDKALVREFVRSALPNPDALPELYGVVTRPQEIAALELPPRFVMKPTHLSGSIKFVTEANPLDLQGLQELARFWLSRNFGREVDEWAYQNVQPKIIFEELLTCGSRIPDDYKFFCFDGAPQFVQVDSDRFGHHRRNFYDAEFKPLPIKLTYDNFITPVQKPGNFDDMLGVARTLSAGTDFLRVDLYNVEGRIVFGELTAYPGGGIERFEPARWDEVFGRHWRIRC